MLPDVVMHEITPRFDPHFLRNLLGDLDVISSIVSSPSEYGVPSGRKRRYTVMVLRTLTERDPHVSPEFIQGELISSVGGGVPDNCGSETELKVTADEGHPLPGPEWYVVACSI
jgi:hypothetical protein